MSSGSAGGGVPAEETLSSEVLTELRTVGGDELVRGLMEVFVERTPGRLRSAVESFAAGDLEATAGALHSLCSASGTIGARRLGELARCLERAARDGAADELAAGLSQLELETDLALRAAHQLSIAAS